MLLSTKVIDPEKRLIPVYIDKVRYEGDTCYFGILKTEEGKKLGEIRYLFEPDHLYLGNIESTEKTYKHVGLALHEFAFRESLLNGKDGHIELVARYSAHAAHLKAGFTPKDIRHMNPFFSNLSDALEKYLDNKSVENKKKIENHPDHPFAATMARYKMGLREDAFISFDAILEHGYYQDISNRLDEILSGLSRGEEKIDTNDLGEVRMYLTDETIHLKKIQFGLTKISCELNYPPSCQKFSV